MDTGAFLFRALSLPVSSLLTLLAVLDADPHGWLCMAVCMAGGSMM